MIKRWGTSTNRRRRRNDKNINKRQRKKNRKKDTDLSNVRTKELLLPAEEEGKSTKQREGNWNNSFLLLSFDLSLLFSWGGETWLSSHSGRSEEKKLLLQDESLTARWCRYNPCFSCHYYLRPLVSFSPLSFIRSVSSISQQPHQGKGCSPAKSWQGPKPFRGWKETSHERKSEEAKERKRWMKEENSELISHCFIAFQHKRKEKESVTRWKEREELLLPSSLTSKVISWLSGLSAPWDGMLSIPLWRTFTSKGHPFFVSLRLLLNCPFLSLEADRNPQLKWSITIDNRKYAASQIRRIASGKPKHHGRIVFFLSLQPSRICFDSSLLLSCRRDCDKRRQCKSYLGFSSVRPSSDAKYCNKKWDIGNVSAISSAHWVIVPALLFASQLSLLLSSLFLALSGEPGNF